MASTKSIEDIGNKITCRDCKKEHVHIAICREDCKWKYYKFDNDSYVQCKSCYRKHISWIMVNYGCPTCYEKHQDHSRCNEGTCSWVHDCLDENTNLTYIKGQCVTCHNNGL